MSDLRQQTLSRTVSPDGTEIGYWSSGSGPSVLLVHGGLGDHTRWDALRPHLESRVTVHAMDRRGRGASGDHPDYAIEREFEDVAAVVDAVASEAGEPVDVYGVSLGGVCAIGGAIHTGSIRRLALYEGWPPAPPEMEPPEGFVERTEALLAAGDPEAALTEAYRTLLQLSDDELARVRSRPEWRARVAAAHTIPREHRAVDGVTFDADHLGRIAAPTLLLVGDQGPDWNAERIAAALPDARIAVLEGQGHMADVLAPDVVARPLLEFLAS